MTAAETHLMSGPFNGSWYETQGPAPVVARLAEMMLSAAMTDVWAAGAGVVVAALRCAPGAVKAGTVLAPGGAQPLALARRVSLVVEGGSAAVDWSAMCEVRGVATEDGAAVEWFIRGGRLTPVLPLPEGTRLTAELVLLCRLRVAEVVSETAFPRNDFADKTLAMWRVEAA